VNRTHPPPAHRLDLIPLLALSEVISVGSVALGPFQVLAPTMYPRASVRRIAEGMTRYHRLPNGGRIVTQSVVAGADLGALPPEPGAAEAERIERSIEAFRYVALLSNRLGHGPNSTHLHIERYGFREGRGRYLTVRSRFMNVFGVKNYQQRAWPQVTPASVRSNVLDGDLLKQLSSVVNGRSKAARRLWRALWWFNQAHHDDPYQPLEFSILTLATAFEALIRPSEKVAGLQRALHRAFGTHDFDDWVRDFYGARSAISHGDEAWQPLFGAHAHIDHYRVASRVFPRLVEQRLVELEVREQPHPLMLSFARGEIERLLVSDEELIGQLLPHSFVTLRQGRNWKLRLDLRFLPVRLNREDFSTPATHYEELIDWIRKIALSACRSGAARYPADRPTYRALSAELARGIPGWSSVHLIPHGQATEAYLEKQSQTPRERPLLGDISLTDLAEAMQAAEERRQMAQIRT
jgi:hypothetical protein